MRINPSIELDPLIQTARILALSDNPHIQTKPPESKLIEHQKES